MKRKTFTSIMILTLTGTAFGVIPCNFTFAEETEYAQEENDVDFAKLQAYGEMKIIPVKKSLR